MPLRSSSDDVVVVISVDGKGIVMRPDALRDAAAKAAGATTPKLGSRLSKGAKCYRKVGDRERGPRRRAGSGSYL